MPPRRLRLAPGFAALLACICLLRGAAGAPPVPPPVPPAKPAEPAAVDELERRLKEAGVEVALRARVNEAVKKGAAWLMQRQTQSGGFRSESTGLPGSQPADFYGEGLTALCTLALQHTALAECRESVRRAVAHLAAPPVWAQVSSRTYEAGIAAMLFAGIPTETRRARDLALALAGAQRKSGWWDYDVGRPPPGTFVNLSTTQFAVLGLWAGRRAGADIPAKVWERVVDSHVRAQSTAGAWDYRGTANDSVRALGIPLLDYPQGAWMAMADLLLAKEALQPDTDASRLKAIEKTLALGMRRVELDVPAWLAVFEAQGRPKVPLPAAMIIYPYYCLYALEKLAIFLGRETLGGAAWYRQGAAALLARQRPDGAWGTAQGHSPLGPEVNLEVVEEEPVIATAFALLFLVRSPMLSRPAPVVTPTEKPPPRPPGNSTPAGR
jgi:hypothetical protein